MLSIPVFVSFALLAAGSIEARPLDRSLDNLPGSVASFQELWTRASSSLATIFRKDTSSADPNGLKRSAVRSAPGQGPAARLTRPVV
jgi:hypothetical protein